MLDITNNATQETHILSPLGRPFFVCVTYLVLWLFAIYNYNHVVIVIITNSCNTEYCCSTDYITWPLL